MSEYPSEGLLREIACGLNSFDHDTAAAAAQELLTLRHRTQASAGGEMVERSRAFWNSMRHTDEFDSEDVEALSRLLTSIRSECLEECAKVAETTGVEGGHWRRDIAAAIRSLRATP